MSQLIHYKCLRSKGQRSRLHVKFPPIAKICVWGDAWSPNQKAVGEVAIGIFKKRLCRVNLDRFMTTL